MIPNRILAYLLVTLGFAAPASATLFATSSEGYAGSVSLAYSKIKATVGAQWIDIEEDAEISTAPYGGTATGPWLVDGTFNVPTGTVVVGCLLWNDDTLLMGKLRGKADATHKFDSLVPTQTPGYKYDPLLVEQVGDSTYHLKLYPVADGGTRRIRLRYLVPGGDRLGRDVGAARALLGGLHPSRQLDPGPARHHRRAEALP